MAFTHTCTGVGECHILIENRVHGGLDGARGEDTNRVRQGESAHKLAFIRTLALHLLRRETSGPAGIAAQQMRTGWDHRYL